MEERRGGPPRATRERIIRLLLKGPLTVDILAGRLGITPNAVRAQMALLEREGMVAPGGTLKGPRRPTVLFALRPGAEVPLSRAYPQVTARLVKVLSAELTRRQFDGVMKKLGRSLASAAPSPTGTPRARLQEALAFLNSYGTNAQMSERAGTFVIQSDFCPIGAAVKAHPRSCLAMVAMLQDLTGLRVEEACTKGEMPSCRFVIRTRAAAPARTPPPRPARGRLPRST